MQLKHVEKFKQEIHKIVKRFMQLLKPVEENIQGRDS
jgi:hypothetical protein